MHTHLHTLSLIPESGEFVVDPTNSMFGFMAVLAADSGQGVGKSAKQLELVILDVEPRESVKVPYPPKVDLERNVSKTFMQQPSMRVVSQGRFWVVYVDDNTGCLYMQNKTKPERGRCRHSDTQKLWDYCQLLAKNGVKERQIADLVSSLVYSGKHD